MVCFNMTNGDYEDNPDRLVVEAIWRGVLRGEPHPYVVPASETEGDLFGELLRQHTDPMLDDRSLVG